MVVFLIEVNIFLKKIGVLNMKISSSYLFSLAYQYINQVNYFGSSYIKKEIKKEVNYQYCKTREIPISGKRAKS